MFQSTRNNRRPALVDWRCNSTLSLAYQLEYELSLVNATLIQSRKHKANTGVTDEAVDEGGTRDPPEKRCK